MATIPASLKTAVAAPKVPDYIILYGEMPPAVSYLTEKGKTVFFYKGYHVATDPEVVEYCKTIPGIAMSLAKLSWKMFLSLRAALAIATGNLVAVAL